VASPPPIGLVIDDAIVVVEAIYAKLAAGLERVESGDRRGREIFLPLVGINAHTCGCLPCRSDRPWKVSRVSFFRALALTMAVGPAHVAGAGP
jgi:hypothetical protein